MEPTFSHLLGPGAPAVEIENVHLVPAKEGWVEPLRRHIASATEGQFFLIVYERRWRQVVKLLMAGRIAPRGPTYSQLSRQIRQWDFSIHNRFAIWPNASEPRIAYPYKQGAVARYLQWAGLIGGGRVFGLKLLARELPVGWTRILFPAEALIVRKS